MDELKTQLKINNESLGGLKDELKALQVAYPDILNRPQEIKDEIKDLKDRIARLESQNMQAAMQVMQNITELEKEKEKTAQAQAQNQEKFMKVILKRTLDQDIEYLAENWSESKRTKGEQKEFRTDLINFYQREDPQNPNNLICMVLNQSLPKAAVIASHIWKSCTRGKGLDRFGLDATDLNSPRNGLLLAEPIEKAFDVLDVCFVYNTFNKCLTFHVLNPALLQIVVNPLDPNSTFGQLHGRPLQHPANAVPYRRILGLHAKAAFRDARTKRWISDTDYNQFQDYLELSGDRKSVV